MKRPSIPDGPWKVVVAGSQFGVRRASAPRDEDDLCMGTMFAEAWEARAVAQAISALPDFVAAAYGLWDLYGDGSVSADPHLKRALAPLLAALKKAGKAQ